MLTAVRWLLSKVISPLWVTVEAEGEELFLRPSAGSQNIRHLRDSVVTSLCLDYGMIDGSVYFTSEEVMGGRLLKEGDVVNCVAFRDGAEGGWRALRVEKSAAAWEEGSESALEDENMKLRPLIGTVTSFDGESGYINQTTYFPRSSLLEGYEPMKGDWVQAEYVINPTRTRAQSVAPLRYSRLDEAFVTSMFGRNGVVDDAVFFSLDSVLLPANYQPHPGHLVNLVMVESSQSFYCWRALCMAPCPDSGNAAAKGLTATELSTMLENKGGLVVTDYGHFPDLLIGESAQLVLWIQNEGSETHTLRHCDFAGWDSEQQFSLLSVDGPKRSRPKQTETQDNSELDTAGEVEPDEGRTGESKVPRKQSVEVEIAPGERLSVSVACDAKSLGNCKELLMLHFSSFIIGRQVEVTVGSQEENMLQPSAPYSRQETHNSVENSHAHVIAISAPKPTLRLSQRRLPTFLPSYPLPQAFRDAVDARSDVLVIEPCLGEVLSAANMHARFSALLWLEELHAEKELQEFTIHGALLRKGSSHLHLEVLGLSEGRPSLSINDKILLKKSQASAVVLEYISYITEINDDEVSLRVNTDLHRTYLGEPLDVEFMLNRLTLRRCHHALALTKHLREILFPTSLRHRDPQWSGEWIDGDLQNLTEDAEPDVSVDTQSKSTQTKDGRVQSRPIPSPGHFFNPDLNSSQREAVKRILAGECRPTPYMLFGPPGTGKTITLIEAILQVHHRVTSSRVLVCTPSNSAADLICIRLHYSGFLHSGSFVRVNASSRLERSIPEVLWSYSRAGEDIRKASFYRIIVTTCSSAGMFLNVGLREGHFTHVFLDEAGQAMEPESLIPISMVSERHGQIVLAGDHCQLGPLVKSKQAAAFGLGVSLMERLMSNPLYIKHKWGYNPNLVTKLVYNYRSHQALLKLPSQLFYQDELRCKAHREVVESLCQWTKLPRKGFPLLFHGVRGYETREGCNPSWFNPAEAVQVMFYCCQLTKKLYHPVDPTAIGIIAPYRKQCEKIRVLLGKMGLSDIKVGSVEEFQGQEFLVIILSTVRSNDSVASNDLQSVLGFLSNPKRFNVAITRPKALLIVVGNPHVLVKDPCFWALLQYCHINGAYVGCDLPAALRDAKHLTRGAESGVKVDH
ncbi:RNA helicase Mov10l1 isoform X3 [Synchiropus splendidus]|uniref:RNA helicase Mov10l1 isoform X3 n=1 Tax=Synchiropus splendidus TaxID=270530 RepID=UPI00237DB21A|nr:RNA helicase Mov10l1 isoform X3 [Synchiropus splendidus]